MAADPAPLRVETRTPHGGAPGDAGPRLVLRESRPMGTAVKVGGVTLGAGAFVVMGGPCAVENEETLEAVARTVHSAGAHMLRGGVFKPRTSPYAFQGLGEEGVRLLAAAGKRWRLPVVAEVMEPAQIGLLSPHVDLLQVGARNMQNFSLLRELGTLRQPVLLKRGFSATIKEWLLAAEYILAGGNTQVILCERGIRTFETETRFTLDLSSVPVVQQQTHLPVIVDPSHATGRRDLVIPMALAAAACGANGLLVEVHPNPDEALSDGPQALTPPMFQQLMARLAPVLAACGSTLHPASPRPVVVEAP